MKHLLISCLLLSAAGTLQAVPKSNIPPLKLWYNKPATAFEESLPIGNGKLGALIYGGANNDSIYLNDITLWTGKPVNREEGGMPTNGYQRFARLCSKKITRQPTLYNCMYKDTIQNTISHLPSSISKMQIKDNSVTTSVN